MMEALWDYKDAKNKNLLINCDLSIQFRNFVATGLVNELAGAFKKVIVLYNPKNSVIPSNVPDNVTFIANDKFHLRHFKEKMFFATRLDYELKRPEGSYYKESLVQGLGDIRFVKLTRFLWRGFSRPLLKFLINWDFFFNKKKYQTLGRFDLYFSTSFIWQHFDISIGLYAQKIGVPWIMQITSFDNPTTKGKFVFKPDQVIVWGQHNFEEAQVFLEMPKEKITVIPPPQFEFLKQVRQRHLEKPSKKYIYYFGVTVRNHTWEKDLIKEMLFWLSTDQSFHDIYLLLRPHPNDLDRWWEKFKGHPKLILDEEVINRKCAWSVYSEDTLSLAGYYEKIKQASCILSYKSTTTLEAVLMGVPVLWPYFDPFANKPVLPMPADDKLHLKYIHKMMENYFFAQSMQELKEKLIQAINNEFDQREMQNLYHQFLKVTHIDQPILPGYVDYLCKAAEKGLHFQMAPSAIFSSGEEMKAVT